jgi:hypothetical protein
MSCAVPLSKEKIASKILIRKSKSAGVFKDKGNGAPGAIRTPGPQIRSLMLYPAELRVH